MHPTLLSLVTLPSLSSPTTVLSSLSAATPAPAPKSSAAAISQAVTAFSEISRLLPVEWLGKHLRAELVDRALAIDLALSSSSTSGESEAEEEEGRADQQRTLRRFVARVGAGAGAKVLVSFVCGWATGFRLLQKRRRGKADDSDENRRKRRGSCPI